MEAIICCKFEFFPIRLQEAKSIVLHANVTMPLPISLDDHKMFSSFS